MDATTIMMDSWSENQTMNMDDALDDLAALTLEIPNMSNQSQPGGGDMLLMTEVSGSTPELLQKTPTQDTLSQDMVSWLLLNAENLPVQNGNMGENLVSTYSYNNPIPMLETKVAPPSPLQLSVSSIGSFLLDPQSEPGLQTSTPRSADSGITSLGTPPRPRGFSCGASPAEDSTKRRRRRTLSEEEQSLRLKRRLEKNRESARICRQRKNQHMQELEGRVHDLQNENTNLRKRLESVDFAEETSDLDDEKDLTSKMAEVIQGNDGEDELHALVDAYKEKFMAAKDQSEKLRYHLEQIEKLIIPTPVTKMGLWTVEHTRGDEGAQSHSLKHELQLSDRQFEHVMASRDKLVAMKGNRQCTLSLLRELRKKISDCDATLSDEIGSMMRILTPHQVAKLILMAQDNSNC